MTTAKDIVAALQKHHPEPDWVSIPEAPNGKWSPQRADLLAMHSWQSRGFEVHGYEVKVSRQDWKKELDNAAKAESWWRWCDKWSLAIPAEMKDKILSAGDVPAGWGLVTVSEKGTLRWVTRPTHHDRTPWPWDLVAVIMSTVDRRRAAGMDQAVSLAMAAHRVEVAELRQKLRNAQNVGTLEERIRELVGQITAFEEATGISLSGYTHRAATAQITEYQTKVIAAVLKCWPRHGGVQPETMARNMRDQADRLEAFAAEIGLS